MAEGTRTKSLEEAFKKLEAQFLSTVTDSRQQNDATLLRFDDLQKRIEEDRIHADEKQSEINAKIDNFQLKNAERFETLTTFMRNISRDLEAIHGKASSSADFRSSQSPHGNSASIPIPAHQDSGRQEQTREFNHCNPQPGVKSKNRTLIISLISTLAVVIVSLSACVLFRCKTKKKEKSSNDSEESALKNGLEKIDTDELPIFEFEKIVAATNGFSTMNKIGEGGFGQVFKGKLQNGQEIAVKRLSSHTGQGITEFRNEILLISKLQHRNLVKIFGCSIKGEEKLIIYEYLANRSLDTFLFDPVKKMQLGWALRYSIIQNVARGLSYLHKDSRLRVIHRDLKAGNILLDSDMNPKISDFGLARSFQATQESANTLRVVGTLGYMSPEYALRGIFSEKSDVFSFGVLMLEMISGKKISSFSYTEHDQSLTAYAWRLWSEGKGLEFMDEETLKVYSETQVERCINIGLLCIQDHVDDRPAMSDVVVMLSSSETSLPVPKKPAFHPELRSQMSEHRRVYSVNEVSVSVVEGR